MNDSIFPDTNILVYAYSETEIEKQIIARNLISEHSIFISTQVLQEFSAILHRKFKKSWFEIGKAISEISQGCVVHTNNETTIQMAIQIAAQYKFSFYDSLIISAALERSCAKLFSEDMNPGQLIERRLTIVNPFSQS